ncbi:MAG: leucine-rich repeat domain-containing protein [Treponema sp.]|jgi:hypothetical protein|nr:leucine-rich repeat domain-containing protein [Treponema sp.]
MKKRLGIVFTAAAVLFLAGCPVFVQHDTVYRVYYSGNGHTAGNPPLDRRNYKPEATVIVKDKPEDMVKNNQQFLGWRLNSWEDAVYTPGTKVIMGYEDIYFEAVWEGDSPFTYKKETENGVTITGYERYGYGSVVIPDTLEDIPVIRIGSGAFYNRSIYSVTLPKTLTHIEANAFGSNYLYEVTIPDTVQEIGVNAFQKNGVSTLSLGEGLVSIGDYAFMDNSIHTLRLPDSLRSIGDGAFQLNSLTEIEIGGDVDIGSDNALGDYGDLFLNLYNDAAKAAGLYRWDGGGKSWKRYTPHD